MTSDETQIRELTKQWHAATKAGDTAAVLALMTEDVVFLTPGNAPMDKAAFAANSAVPPGAPRPQFAIEQQIHEVQVSGDLAFMWSALQVTVTPPGANQAVERSGHTLTVFKRVNGRWLLARDANLLVPKA